MYQELESKLYVSLAAPGYSQAVSMDGANGVMFEWTVFAHSGVDLDVELEESNDLQNWGPLSPPVTGTSTGVEYDRVSTGPDIASAYVRLKFSFASAGTAVVAAGINTANL